MEEICTTAVIQRYLDDLAADSPAEPVVQALLDRSVQRLHQLCATLLHRNYPRLTRPPLNLQSDEMLSLVVERLLKALREVAPRECTRILRPRWPAHSLGVERPSPPLRCTAPRSRVQRRAGAGRRGERFCLSPVGRRIIEAIDNLPAEEREAFDLVRIQGLTHTETAELLGVALKTVKRRLDRGLRLLTESLGDLRTHDNNSHSS